MNFDGIYSLLDHDMTLNFAQTMQNNINSANVSDVSDANISEQNELLLTSGSIDKSTILNELQKLKKRFRQSEGENKKIVKSFLYKIKNFKHELDEFNEISSKQFKYNLPILPFTSHLKLMEYDKKLGKDYDSRANLRHFLRTLIANDYSSFIKKAIKTFIPDELAVHFSWRGTSIKPSVRTFTLIAIIKDITLSKYIEPTETQINRIIQQHFIHANDRLKKKKTV